MLEERWLDPALVRLDLVTRGLDGALDAVAEAVGRRTGATAAATRAALGTRVGQGGIAIGRGVAIPHATVAGLADLRVGFVRLRAPLDIKTPDGQPVDLLFVVVAPDGTEREHLLAIAHIARLAQDDAVLARLRSVQEVDGVLRLLGAPAGAPRVEGEEAPDADAPAAARELLLLEIEGEAALDQLLLELAAMGLDDALLVEGQNLRDALSRELPLFSGFRDLFGDPGGRRLLVLATTPDEAERVLVHLRRVCDEEHPALARAFSIPIQRRWAWTPAPAAGGGH